MRRHLALAATVVVAGAVLASATTAGSTDPKRITFRIPGFPSSIRIADRSVWVTTHRGGHVYRLDPRTNRVAASIDTGIALCFQPAAGAGLLWVSGCPGETGVDRLYAIDVRTNRVLTTIRGSVPVFGAGSLWVWLIASENRLLRLDPRSDVQLARIDAKVGVQNTAPFGVAFGSLWVYSDTAVSRISTNTNKVTAVIRLPGARLSGSYAGGYLYAGYGAFASGKAWVTNPAGLFEIDPASNKARLIRLKLKPFSQLGGIALVSGAGSLWVRTGDTTVARIEPVTGRVVRVYPASGGGGDIAVGLRSLWVTNAADSTVWREPLSR